MYSAPWMDIAFNLLGTKEVKGKLDNPLIVKMFSWIKMPGIKNDETPWCAAFVGSCLEKAGLVSTRSAWALSYAKYGVDVHAPRFGAIAYMERRNASGKLVGGHVTFVAGVRQDGAIMCLGGNQGDAVSVAPFGRARIMGYRWPRAVDVPAKVYLPEYSNDGKKLSTNEA